MAWLRWTTGGGGVLVVALIAAGCGSSSSALPPGPTPDAPLAADGSAPADAPPAPRLDGGASADGATGDAPVTSDAPAGETAIPIDASGDTTPKLVSMLRLMPGEFQMRTGERFSLTATAVFTDATSTPVTGQAAWSSSDIKVATVDTMGQVTAVAAGTATIRASYLGSESTATVTVRQATPSALMLSPAQLSLGVGDTASLSAVLAYSDGSSRDVGSDATWKSSNPTAAEVDRFGTVTAKAKGSADISATYMGLTATAAVAVSDAKLVALVVSPATLSVPRGQTSFLSVTGEFADGSSRNLSSRAAWMSSNTGVATVGNGPAGGTVTALATGNATITVTYLELMTTATVTVP